MVLRTGCCNSHYGDIWLCCCCTSYHRVRHWMVPQSSFSIRNSHLVSFQNQATCRPAAETDEEGPNQTKVAVDVVKQSGLISHLKSTSLSNRGGGASRLDGDDSDQISTCPHCHLALPLLTLRWHQVASLHHNTLVIHMMEMFPD